MHCRAIFNLCAERYLQLCMTWKRVIRRHVHCFEKKNNGGSLGYCQDIENLATTENPQTPFFFLPWRNPRLRHCLAVRSPSSFSRSYSISVLFLFVVVPRLWNSIAYLDYNWVHRMAEWKDYLAHIRICMSPEAASDANRSPLLIDLSNIYIIGQECYVQYKCKINDEYNTYNFSTSLYCLPSFKLCP